MLRPPSQNKQNRDVDKKLAKNVKRDNTPRSKLGKVSASSVQNNEPTKKNETETFSPIAENRTSGDADSNGTQNLIVNFALLRNYATHNFLVQIENSQHTSDNSACEKIRRNAVAALGSKINKGEKELEALPTIRELFEDIVNDAEEKMRMIEEMVKDVTEDYSAKRDALGQLMKVIEETHVQIKASMDGAINQQKLFDQEYELQDNKLGKIEGEIQCASNSLDSLCAQIAGKEKLLRDLNAVIQNTRETSKGLSEEISLIKRKSEDEAAAMSESSEAASKLLNEKMDVVNKMKQEKMRLMKEHDDNVTVKADKTIENENLRKKVDELTANVKAQEILISRVRDANKELRKEKITKLELNEQIFIRIADLEQLANDIVTMQSKVDENQRYCDTLMQIKDELRKTISKRKDAERKLNDFEKEKFKMERKISATKEFIEAAQSSRNDDGGPLAKRTRYSNDENMEVMSDESNVSQLISRTDSEDSTSTFELGDMEVMDQPSDFVKIRP